MLRGLGGLLALALAFFPICWTSSAPAQVAAAQNTPSLATPTADANASWLLDLDAWHAQTRTRFGRPQRLAHPRWPGVAQARHQLFGAAPEQRHPLHAQPPITSACSPSAAHPPAARLSSC